jgi:hypothetical protein
MGSHDFPGYLGWTSEGVVAIHADWPMYPAEHGWLMALRSLGMFPAGTLFSPIDDIDRCFLLGADGFAPDKDDPFSERNFHVALWHDDVLELLRRGCVQGPTGVTRKVWELNRRLAMEGRPPLESWPDAGPPEFSRTFFAQLDDGTRIPLDPIDWDQYEDDPREFLSFPCGQVSVTDHGWRALDDALAAQFTIPDELSDRLSPLLEHELYDTAIREMSVHLEHAMRTSLGVSGIWGQSLVELFVSHLRHRGDVLDAQTKVFRGDLRAIFKFVRNEFAHNVVDIPRARSLALLMEIGELYEAVPAFTSE